MGNHQITFVDTGGLRVAATQHNSKLEAASASSLLENLK
jgi:hypothetical protein